MAEDKKMRVWWIPQVPMKSFNVEVKTLEEAHLLLETLAQYDDFQFKNKVKPDYSSAGGLQIFEDGDWCDWYNEDGNDFDEWRLEHLPKIIFYKE